MIDDTDLVTTSVHPRGGPGLCSGRGRGKVILGVAASDPHVVANHLIAHMLRAQGYDVINLGACTPLAEFAETYARHPDALAILIGSLNGHAKADLFALADIKREYNIRCPVILGGNLSVGSSKELGVDEQFRRLGVDAVLSRPELVASSLSALSKPNGARVT